MERLVFTVLAVKDDDPLLLCRHQAVVLHRAVFSLVKSGSHYFPDFQVLSNLSSDIYPIGVRRGSRGV